jgi:F0F1-type ATP synthase membrane subunit c/vacuolar-type H+-ATPase subunit K
MKKLLTVAFLFVFIIFGQSVSAQELAIGVAKNVEILEEDIQNGHIISFYDGEYKKSNVVYDPNIVGVISIRPAIELKPVESTENQYPVIDKGETLVKVNASNGLIQEGDLITTSETPGVGVKAGNTGFIVGVAKDEWNPENPSEVGEITVVLQPSFNYGEGTDRLQSDLFDIFSLSTVAAYEQPSKVLKHLVAALVLILCIIFGFLTFARVASEGVEAVGRNPSAKRTIGLGIVINVSITIIIVLAGVFVSFLIISL